MTPLDLRSATTELAAAFRRRQDGGGPSDAFFFMVGAGASTPPVPLASGIEADCREELAARGADLSALSEQAPQDPIDRYSFWLSQAYPQPMDRQELFRGLIQGQPISEANFRLAHLLSSPEVPRLVVTTNFDDYLSRALTLFGTPHVVCDHPGTAERIDPERRTEVQILHVHGTYWFYDCCNLRGEIRTRARDTVAHRTIASRLDSILFARSPIVLGYSGWEEDVFMTALRRRLEAHPLRSNIYWFCHTRDAIADLPAFVRDCEYVRVVAPPSSERLRTEPGAEVPRLAAATVVEELIRELQLPAPDLTVNPIHFFSAHLRSSLLTKTGSDGRDSPADMYRLAPMIRRLEAMSPDWTDGEDSPTGPVDRRRQLEQVRDALRRSQYAEAIETAEGLALEGLDETALAELRDTAYLAASQLADELDNAAAGYELARRASELLRPSRQVDATANDARWILATAGTADVHREREAHAAALGLLDDALAQFDGRDDLAAEIGELLDRRAYILWDQDRLDDALAAYKTIEERYAASDGRALRSLADRAILEQAFILNQNEQYEQLVALARAFVGSRTDITDAYTEYLVGRALGYQAEALMELGRHEEAIAVWDRLAELLRTESRAYGPYEPEEIALERAACLVELGRLDDAARAYAQVVDSANEGWFAARGALMQSKVLMGLGRPDDARTALDTLIERFDGTPDYEATVAEAVELRTELG